MTTRRDPGREYERSLPADRRRIEGIHYTPAQLATTVVSAAFTALGSVSERVPERVLDPACGGGAMLLAALDAFVARGVAPADALGRIIGIDIDAGAIDIARRAIGEWADEHEVDDPIPTDLVRWGDALVDDWPVGVDLIVGNPPFGGQLRGATIRDDGRAAIAQRILGGAPGYADTAGLFLVRAVDAVDDGGVVALVQPRSVLASRDAGRVRELVDAAATMVEVLVPETSGFDASVHVCVPILCRGRVDGAFARPWSESAADASGLPPVDLDATRTLGDLADLTAGFRDEFYAVAAFVEEADADADVADGGDERPRLVTSGSIEPGRVLWGERAATVLRRRFLRPVVDVDGLRAHVDDRRLASRLGLRTQPKVLVATQTRTIEAVVDVDGSLWPSVPVVSVLPRDGDVWPILAVLVSRDANAWIARRSFGTGLSPGALRISARSLAELPIPRDEQRRDWDDAAERLRDGAAVDDPAVLDAMSRAYSRRR